MSLFTRPPPPRQKRTCRDCHVWEKGRKHLSTVGGQHQGHSRPLHNGRVSPHTMTAHLWPGFTSRKKSTV